jgi:succinate dehydrogenase / fumarate reductase cytochrome b subunit
MWIVQTLSSNIGKKLIMSLTGLFLIIFLIVHVSGNLLLLKGDEGKAFNMYAEFMTTNPVIKASSYILYSTFVIHIVWALLLTIANSSARKVDYSFNSPSANSQFNSRNMGILGTLLLIFLIIHMQNFWYEFKFGNPPTVTYEGSGEYRDLYTIVVVAFSQSWYTLFYVSSMIALSFHLWHGFQSAFQTLGLNHKKYTPLIEVLGKIYSVLIPSLFATLPIWVYFFKL